MHNASNTTATKDVTTSLENTLQPTAAVVDVVDVSSTPLLLSSVSVTTTETPKFPAIPASWHVEHRKKTTNANDETQREVSEPLMPLTVHASPPVDDDDEYGNENYVGMSAEENRRRLDHRNDNERPGAFPIAGINSRQISQQSFFDSDHGAIEQEEANENVDEATVASKVVAEAVDDDQLFLETLTRLQLEVVEADNVVTVEGDSEGEKDCRVVIKKRTIVAATLILAVVVIAAVIIAVLVSQPTPPPFSNETSTPPQPPGNFPNPSPLGTIAPTSSDLLSRSSSFNNETSTPSQNIDVNPFVWASLGSELDGQFANQTMGYSISLASVGYILAVGSPYTQDFSHPGSVSVFHLVNNSNWTLLGDVIPGISNGEGFGWSVDISDIGETVAASAPVSGKGRVAVYQYDPVGSKWQQVGDDLVGDYDGQNFGYSVSLSGIGNIVASGAPGNTNDTGLVAVYQFSGSKWEPMGSPIPGAFVGQRFGGSVSLSLDGQTLAVGTIEHKCSKQIEDVRVFHWNGSYWQLMGDPINGTSANDQCAMSVSLSADGTTVAAGAWLSMSDVNPQIITGNVLVFRWDLDHWEQLGSSIPGESEGGNFGVSVALSLDGNLLAAGANFAGKNGAGGVRVFYFNQTWEPYGSIINGEEAFENFGKSVAISPGGRVVAGGAYLHSSHGIEDSGQVRVYTWF
jgi:hypothetical protein